MTDMGVATIMFTHDCRYWVANCIYSIFGVYNDPNKTNIRYKKNHQNHEKVTFPPKTPEIRQKACLCTFIQNLAIIRFANTYERG